MTRLPFTARVPTPALLAAGFLFTHPLHAERLSDEPFAGYTAGAELQSAGNPAVPGYTGSWTEIDFGDAEPVVTAGSLVYPDPAYLGSGGDRVAKAADTGGIASGNSGRVFRLLDASLAVDDATTGTRYLSWLFQTGNENAAPDPAVYQTLALYNGSTADAHRSFDAGIASGDFATPDYAFRANNSASLRRNLGVARDADVHLFVAKFTLGEANDADSVTVWIDPPLGGGGDPAGGVTVSGINLRFDRLALSDYASNSSAWDEIRWGTTFDSVTLAPPVPAFVKQPSGHTGSVGDAVMLVAQASGNPPPALQWEHSSDGGDHWEPLPGETAATLEIPAAPHAANGFYRIVATNANGTTVSETAEVRLAFPPPRIVEEPKPLGIEPGGDATFNVTATGLGNLTYQWRKNGVDLPGETAPTLNLSGVTEDDLGAYSVRVTDDAATAESLPATASVTPAALLIFGDLDGYQSGLTYRLYDIQEPIERLHPLVPGQTPNVDEKRDTIDWTGSAAFSGHTGQFMVEAVAELFVPAAGMHDFRLTSSDGSQLWIGDELVINHDGEHEPTAETGSATLAGGLHPLRVRFFLNTGTPALKLEWRPEGEDQFAVVPESHLLTPSFVTRVVAPGKKNIIKPGDGTRPGNGAPLVSVHPEWEVHTIRPPGFNPKVGALAVHPDGRLFVATFEPNQDNNSGQPATPNGRIWALTHTDGNDPAAVGVTEVANGLFEPAGMTFVGDTLHVSQRLEVTRLLDDDGDGFYETHQRVGGGWESNNYHMFHFGLIERDGFAYSTLSTSIIFSYNGLNGPNPPNRGTWVRTNLATGKVDYLAGGLRTPNGIGFGPDGDIFQTDNQGSWQPASRLNHLREGHFYGHYNNTEDGGAPSLHSDKPVTPPAVWLPQNEISNSPTQPLLIPEGHDFAGDMLVGELTLGGIRRVSLEKVRGEWQGAVYRFTQGFEAGVNRIEWAPDGSLYVGCIGATGNWSWNGTTRGLQRLSRKPGAAETFEIDRVEATPDGFRIRYTKPVPAATLEDPANFGVKQWTYQPSQDYGGAKIGLETLPVASSAAAADRRSVELSIPGLKEGHVVHLKSDLVSESGEAIWSSEAWYTLNAIPGGPENSASPPLPAPARRQSR